MYGACVVLRDTIKGDRDWLDGNCRRVLPHSYEDRPVYTYGTSRWYKDGKLHRDGDLPAVICADGTQQWYKEGELHRDGDLPAVIQADGRQYWFRDGERQYWYEEGKRQTWESVLYRYGRRCLTFLKICLANKVREEINAEDP